MTKVVVQLRLIKGKVKSYDENQKLLNVNQTCRLETDCKEWTTFLKRMKQNGFNFYEVIGINDLKGNPIADADELISIIKSQLDNALRTPEQTKTPEQMQIDALKAQIDALTNGAAKTPKAPKQEENTGLSEARKAYTEKFGKEPKLNWGLLKLQEELNK